MSRRKKKELGGAETVHTEKKGKEKLINNMNQKN